MTRCAAVFLMFLIVLAVGCGSKDPTDRPLSPQQRATLDLLNQVEGHTSFQDPKASWSEGAGYTYRYGTRAAGGILAKVLLLGLMLTAMVLVLRFIPRLIHGKAGTIVSGAALLLAGFVLLGSGWPANLDETAWVWLGLVIPGAFLFILGWFLEDGPWTAIVAFTPWSILLFVLAVRLLGLLFESLLAGCMLAILIVCGLIVAVMRLVKFGSGENGSEKPKPVSTPVRTSTAEPAPASPPSPAH